MDHINKLPFYTAMTDNGLCDVYNGNSMADTFNSPGKLQKIFDNREEIIIPRPIKGTGLIHRYFSRT